MINTFSKYKVLLITFIIPFLFFLIILYRAVFLDKNLNFYIGLAILSIMTINILSNKAKYVYDVKLIGNYLELSYFSPLLLKRRLNLDPKEIIELKVLHKSIFDYGYSRLKFKNKNKLYAFRLINKEIKKKIDELTICLKKVNQ
jgi:hypothetical protein